ncbi:PREDICTED: zinc finger protein 37 homolog [Branchiostoma belcheri]|uniref:Zinc finger protein 37 homolog n=1 Tax=Branchiostoma belcheri TaxID=7741 RepID=A0A6P4ZG46_BRABE|nr:PREDICTED: zinc finger protein 37 homolog [Branchiostoma belcheri]
MATVPTPLHGLSREVTMAVLPRLYLEEVILELSRRDINIGGFHTGKDHLISVLKHLMAREYADLGAGESQTKETGSRNSKDKTADMEHDLGKQDASQRIPNMGTKQDHATNECHRVEESTVQRLTNMSPSDQVGSKDGNVELDNNVSRQKGKVTNQNDKNLAAETNQSRASSNDRIQTAKTTAKRSSSDVGTKYFDALPEDVRHHLEFCDARVVLKRLEHKDSSGFLRHKKRRSQVTGKGSHVTSAVTSDVPQRSLDNAVPNVNGGDTKAEVESNDFLLEAEQLGYKTRLRWNTIIQSDLQSETESEPKTTAKENQKIGTTSSGRPLPPSDGGKSKQPASPVDNKRNKARPHEESKAKTPAKGKQKVGTTSSGRQPPCKNGKRKQPSPVSESVMSHMKKVWFPEDSEESMPETYATELKIAAVSSGRKQPSNIKKGILLTPASEAVLSKLKKVQLPKKSVPKTSAKGKQKIGRATGQPSNDGKSPNPEGASVRPIIRRNRTKHVYVCEDCGYRSKSRCHMIVHIRKHTGEKPFGCCLCSYRGTSEKNLRTHMQKHIGLESPHVCEYCGYTTGSRNALVKHIRTHTGERPYVCNICGYSASNTSRIAEHIRTHTNERTFRCPQCTYRANRRDSLVRHYLTHTGDKPFHCTLCDYKSTQKSTLKRHVVLMHEKRKDVKEKEKREHNNVEKSK